ncbi:MAG: hypothetical protein IAE86_06890 [Burkholderiaceae bacterium]|nr:hypothetical protein [Burkholderiaceae bacterium]
MHLYRAHAYQLQHLETFSAAAQPEVMVFFESHTPEAAPATLLRLLALSWGCTPADVEFYNLTDEHDLRAEHGPEAPGDAALWVTGHAHGPLFHAVDRTLMFVRPLTLTRLLQARQATAPLRALQRAAERDADERRQRQQREAHAFMTDLARMVRGQPARS